MRENQTNDTQVAHLVWNIETSSLCQVNGVARCNMFIAKKSPVR